MERRKVFLSDPERYVMLSSFFLTENIIFFYSFKISKLTLELLNKTSGQIFSQAENELGASLFLAKKMLLNAFYSRPFAD